MNDDGMPWLIGIIAGVGIWGLITFLAYLPWELWT